MMGANDILDRFRPGPPGGVIRLGVMGAPGTGKSSLSARLAELLGVPLIPEIARDFHSRGRVLGPNSSIETQLLMMLAQAAMESRLVHFVADRTIYDPIIHVDAVAAYNCASRPDLALNCMANYLGSRHGPTYSHVFVLTHSEVRKQDGVRETDPRYASLVHDRTLFWLNALNIHHVILEGDMESHWTQARKLLGCDGN
ncbi:ATP-binding protein [Bradyrhizobium arachidis]|uniref:ATP/GTP-binding protein n=1 Tax=Bradyrhizobium arachidis TaxID=858423 RepID=UPI00216282F2|nr:ATP-binding protein [Bradyrhizobium arachidis]UVO30155.1 ATP-binding protein [Bradyrhizobium arachidis]